MSEYTANSDEKQKEEEVKAAIVVKDHQNLFFEACSTLQTFESSGKTLPANWNRRQTHRELIRCMIPAKN